MADDLYRHIDPGKSGAMAFVFREEDTVIANAIPFNKEAYIKFLKELQGWGPPTVCCIEKVSSMRGWGVSTSFVFGENFGWIQGVLEAFEIPYELIPPKKWKAEFGLASDKVKSVEVCKRLFPSTSLLRTEKCKKDDDNMAEALLMAEYARRRL